MRFRTVEDWHAGDRDDHDEDPEGKKDGELGFSIQGENRYFLYCIIEGAYYRIFGSREVHINGRGTITNAISVTALQTPIKS